MELVIRKSAIMRRFSDTFQLRNILPSKECGTVTQLSLRLPETQLKANHSVSQAANRSNSHSTSTLSRRIDKSVSIDESSAGFMIGISGRSGIWQDVVLLLPPNLTNGKTSIEIETKSFGRDVDLNISGYTLRCLPKDGGGWNDKSYGPTHPQSPTIQLLQRQSSSPYPLPALFHILSKNQIRRRALESVLMRID